MPQYKPTDEQQAIIDAICKPASKNPLANRNLLVTARAGAAKTSTIELATSKLSPQPVLACAFNKRIATEMEQRLPGFVNSRTFNSLGHRAWAATLAGRLKVESRKVGNLTTSRLKSAPDSLKNEWASLVKLVGKAKSVGLVPDAALEYSQHQPLTSSDWPDIFDLCEIDENNTLSQLADEILMENITQAHQGIIDFDDQIYMPTLFQGKWSAYPLVFVDEAQDLSPLNHLMLTKLVGKRLVAVGDPAQSIYAFRGASHTSMDQLRDRFDMADLKLTMTFRCPKSVVELANKHVHDMRTPDTASDGKVAHWTDQWTAQDLPQVAAIICRNNGPLFNLAFKLIRSNRSIKMFGTDMMRPLKKILSSLGSDSTKAAEATAALEEWKQSEIRKARELKKSYRVSGIIDRAECILALFESGNASNILEAKQKLENLMSANNGTITLTSGHRSKGFEWDFVVFLDAGRIPSKWAQQAADKGDMGQMIQENNLRYVIQTRSKSTLIHANADEFTMID